MCNGKNLVDCATHCNNALHSDFSNKTITLLVYYNGTTNSLPTLAGVGSPANGEYQQGLQPVALTG